MKSKALLVHSSNELKKVCELESTLKDSCDIYFLTADVDYPIMNQLGVNSYHFYDSHINTSELKTLHTKAILLTDSWYLNEKGEDLSLIEDFSVGRCFHQFLCHTFCLALKYQIFLSRLNEKYNEIILTETPNSLLQIFLSEEIIPQNKMRVLKIKDPNAFIPSTVIALKTNGLETFFLQKFSFSVFVRKCFVKTWMKVKRTSKTPNKVFFVPAGKTQDLIQHYVNNVDNKINFIFPLTSESLALKFSNLYYLITPGLVPSNNLSKSLMQKMQNEVTPKSDLSKSIILNIIQGYLAEHFDGIFSYYKSAHAQLKSSSPHLVVLSAESHETNIIIAQAAKNLKIKTCIIPHGITFPLLSESYYKGPATLYDSAFLFSNADKEAYQKKGFSFNQLYVSSFHYFSKFLPFKNIEFKKINKKALILPPDFSDFCRLRYSVEGTQKIIDSCIQLGMSDIAIKTRVEAQLKSLFIRDGKIIHNNREIPIYSGYTSFPHYAKDVDIVVGPPSSATIESLLMGIPYFCYQEEEAFIGGWENSNIDSILHIARTPEELQKNITNNLIFKNSKSIDDLIFISKLNNQNDFIDIFEQAVMNCLSTTGN